MSEDNKRRRVEQNQIVLYVCCVCSGCQSGHFSEVLLLLLFG